MTRYGFRCTLARLGFDLDHDTDSAIWEPWIAQRLYEAEKSIGLQKAVIRVRSAIRMYDMTKDAPHAKNHLAAAVQAVNLNLAQKSCTTFATTSKETAVKTIKVNLSVAQKQELKDAITGLKRLLNKSVPFTAYSATWELYGVYSHIGSVYFAVRDTAEADKKAIEAGVAAMRVEDTANLTSK
jgi:hypothetical protein